MEFFAWIEQSALSRWVAESIWGFPIALTLHAIGMGFLAGFNFAFALRMLGVARGVKPQAFVRFFPLLWGSAVLSLVSGLLLLAAYPAKSLTNPLFYLKMGLIISGLVLIRKLAAVVTAHEATQTTWDSHSLLPRHNGTTQDSHNLIRGREKPFAVILLLLWCAAITCGRFLAYTYSVLTVSDL